MLANIKTVFLSFFIKSAIMFSFFESNSFFRLFNYVKLT